MHRSRRSKTKPSPKQHALVTALRQEIVRGRLAPGSRVPTRVELAARHGLSVLTVQRALELLEHDGFVESRGSQGTFVAPYPPHLCRYGLVFVNPSSVVAMSNYWSTLAQDAESLARAQPRRVQTYYDVDAHADNESFHHLAADIAAHRLAGVIFTSPPLMLAGMTPMTDRALPRVVLAHEPYEGSAVLSLDYDALIYQAMDIFRAQGRRRLAAIALSNIDAARVQFISDAAVHRGMRCPIDWIHGVDHLHPAWAGAIVRLLMWLPHDQRPDALLILDDNLVEHATGALIGSGLSVPHDVGVVAHCNLPRLSTSLVPAQRLGFDTRAVLEKAMDLIDRQHAGLRVPDRTLIPAVRAPSSGARSPRLL